MSAGGQHAAMHGLQAGAAHAIQAGGGTNTARAMGAMHPGQMPPGMMGGPAEVPGEAEPPPAAYAAFMPGMSPVAQLADQAAHDAYLEAAARLGIMAPASSPPHHTAGELSTDTYSQLAPQ